MSPRRLGLWLAPVLLAVSASADPVHVVRPGETLWQIAALLSGDPDRWPELYRANRDQIRDPSRLYPGQRLAIPEFPGNDAGADGASIGAAPKDALSNQPHE